MIDAKFILGPYLLISSLIEASIRRTDSRRSDLPSFSACGRGRRLAMTLHPASCGTCLCRCDYGLPVKGVDRIEKSWLANKIVFIRKTVLQRAFVAQKL